jgi:Mn-containing catalase
MLHDIAIEEFSHLEMVGPMIEQHTEKATGAAKDAAYKSTLFAVRGVGPHLVDSRGQAWTSAYVNEAAMSSAICALISPPRQAPGRPMRR